MGRQLIAADLDEIVETRQNRLKSIHAELTSILKSQEVALQSYLSIKHATEQLLYEIKKLKASLAAKVYKPLDVALDSERRLDTASHDKFRAFFDTNTGNLEKMCLLQIKIGSMFKRIADRRHVLKAIPPTFDHLEGMTINDRKEVVKKWKDLETSMKDKEAAFQEFKTEWGALKAQIKNEAHVILKYIVPEDEDANFQEEQQNDYKNI